MEKEKTGDSMFKRIINYITGKSRKLSDIELHYAGATVRHKSPFDSQQSLRNDEPLSQEFLLKWAKPFYIFNSLSSEEFLKQYVIVKDEINDEIISLLLGDFNWRSRTVGTIFATIQKNCTFEDIIGVHLLKSEVCYAGYAYSIAMASSGSDNAISYLKKYLDYYLEQKNLWFDQGEVMAALNWIDQRSGTSEMDAYLDRWNEFIANKPNWDLDINIKGFKSQMDKIQEIQNALGKKNRF